MSAPIVKQQVAETLADCWSHCDTKQEEETLLWIAEKLALTLGERYEFADHRETVARVHVLDGPRRTFGNYPLTSAVAL